MVVSGGNAPVDRLARRLATHLRSLRPDPPSPGRIDALPAAVVLLLALSSAFVAVAPSGSLPNAGKDAGTVSTDSSALDALWSAFPAPLDPVTALGPAAPWLFEGGEADSPRLKEAPSDAAGLFGRVLDPSVERLPVPDAPDGPEPLLSALQPAGSDALAPADLASLRAQIASLRLVPEAERALSRLVLAYARAAEVEAQADGLEPALAVQDRVRAADLLMRTLEEVKDPLALPPAPLRPLQQADLLPLPSPAEPAASAAAPVDAWDLLRRVVSATASRQPASALPPLPRESLPDALAGLAKALGAPPEAIDLPVADLPPSLADAVATIVTARRVGLESDDAGVHSLLLLQATREAEPTLRAWGALLALDAKGLDAGSLPIANLDSIARQALSTTTASPATLFAQAHGRPAPAPSRPPSLASLLELYGMDAETSAQAAASLPPGVAAAVAVTLAAMEALAAAQQDGLTPEGKAALQQTSEVAGLLAQPQWSRDEAGLVLAWSQAADSAQRSAPALVDAQAAALAAAEAAAMALQRPLVNPWPAAKEDDGSRGRSLLGRAADFITGFQVIGTARAQPLPATIGCPAASPLSRCGDDVWFHTEQGGGVLVTGYGETIVGNNAAGSFRYGAPPRLILDLGGNDHYLVAAGAASAAMPTSIVIDLGGNDHYEARQALAHGSASGRGTLGILWDSAGDDRYEHVGDPGASENLGQGAGVLGGLGALVDGGGRDVYGATRSFGQGFGQGAEFPLLASAATLASDFAPKLLAYMAGLGGTGLLLDLGAGSDEFRADGGQGHARGGGALGLLANEQGRSTYSTVRNDGRFQGGVAAGAVGSVAALADIGGQGSFYSNPQVVEGTQKNLKTQFRSHHRDDGHQRQDDALWAIFDNHAALGDALASVGFGLDSSLQDEDRSQPPTPNLVELAFASDPHDADDEPGISSAGSTVGDALELLSSLVSDPPGVEDVPGLANQVTGLVLGALQFDNFSVPLFNHYDRVAMQCTEDPVSLLLLLNAQDETVTERTRAHLLIDLGGNTTYRNEVAGPGDVCVKRVSNSPGQAQDLNFTGVGSYALDLGGDDRYDTPEKDRTQGAVAGRIQANATQSQLSNPLRTTPPVSMLVDLQGNDSYAARELSQGSAFVEGTYFKTSTTQNCQTISNGAAWLIDTAGSDTYVAKKRSQASVLDAGTAALLDLGGDDDYTFDTQATDQNDGPCNNGRTAFPRNALLLDGGGKDRYNGTRPLEDDDQTKSLQHQGRAQTGSGNTVTAAFVDVGTDQDVYTVPSRLGATLDVSGIKNDNLTTGTGPRFAFLDNPTFLVGGPDDQDGDGAPSLVENLFQTNRKDPGDSPGTVWGTPGRAQGHLVDPAGAPQDSNLTGTEGDGAWFKLSLPGQVSTIPTSTIPAPLKQYFSRLTIGGRGSSHYAGEAPSFLVDLGGDDRYTADQLAGSQPPGLGVHANTGQVKIVLDVGGGNDTYAPGSGPNLGAATRGIAILADAGGRNMFTSAGAATQGAATTGSVGALVTWNATSQFDAAVANGGLAQGAGATGGIGVLASFGNGVDQYLARGSALTQGTGAAALGHGILLDGGGDNLFSAPHALAAQGASTGGVGILWSGVGNDRYEAPGSSQGSGSGRGVGVLVDMAGDDSYRANGSQAQGAGRDGMGLLLDLGGHDQYLGGSGVQGAGSGPGGLGLLLDVSGRDRYEAQGAGQGASDCSGSAGAFVDGQGRDRYIHGGGKRPAVSGQTPGAGDNDWAWMQPGNSEEVLAGNPTQAPCMLGLGIDSEALAGTLFALRDLVANPSDRSGLTVDLQVESERFIVPSEATVGRVAGNVTLRAVVRGLADPDQLRRVSFFFDDRWEAEGRLVRFDSGTRVAEYEHVWVTESRTFSDEEYPDRNYTVRAAAFVEPDPARASPLGTPDLPSYDSGSFVARVDNGPLLGATLSKAGATLGEMILTPGGAPASLDVTLGGDLEWPRDEAGAMTLADPACAGGSVPGGFLAIRAAGPGAVHTVLEGYCPSGSHRFSIDGTNGGSSWPDGQYDLTVVAQDANGTQAVRAFTLHIDGLPPNSTVLTPPIVGLDRLSGDNLRLDWRHADPDGSGVDEVYVFQVDPATLAAVERHGPYAAGTTRMEEARVQHNQTVAFVTVAVDRAGNSEADCLTGEEPLFFAHDSLSCYQAKAAQATRILVDARAPQVSDPFMTRPGVAPGSLAHSAVRPGSPVEFTVDANDDGSGIDRILIRFFDSTGAATHHGTMSGVGRTYRYDAWDASNQDDHGGIHQEGRFFYETTVFDLAGNQQSSGSSGILDSLPPRVDVRTEYVDEGGQAREAGGPGVKVLLHVDVQDIQVAGLTVDTRPLGKLSPAFPCTPPPGESTVHACTVSLDGVRDGTYLLPLNATDAAGNSNTAERALVVVSGQPLPIEGVNVTGVGHDWFAVEWTTPEPGSSIVESGRLPWADGEEAPQATQAPGLLTKTHRVNVTGLSPSSTYFLRAVSESAGGVRNASALLSVRTLNAYTLDLSSLGDRILRGQVALDYTLSMRSPEDKAPVAMRVLVQDAALASSPVEVAPTFQQAEGHGEFTLDTTRFADGLYRAIAELDRLGDFNRTLSAEFRIDNTAPIVTPLQPRPGSSIASAQPTIQVALLDPLGHAPPPAGTLQVRVDGVSANVSAITEDTVSASGTRRVTFTLDRALAHGNHTIEVSVADLAGNREGTAWPFGVDVRAPALAGQVDVTPLPGPVSVRPGGRMRVAVDLSDAAAVAEVHLDLARLDGPSVALASLGDSRWQVEAMVPEAALAGTHLLPILAKDALGNEGQVAVAEVAVDDRPATVLQASASDTRFLDATIHLATDEPTVVRGGGAVHSATWAREHTFKVEGLSPGTQQAILLNVTDGAGHVTPARVVVATPQDIDPPTAPGNAAAESAVEGVVRLSWSAATDNSAVRHYVVERDAAKSSPAMRATVAQPGFHDLEAPAGHNVVYRVTAVDAAGLAGPSVELQVRVLALPHLSQPSIAPLRAKATEPVTFQVEYHHASGSPAHAVWVLVGGTSYPLALVPGQACHDGCLYQAKVLLPTSQLASVHEAVFFADDGANQDRLAVAQGPIVSLAGTGKGAAVDLDVAKKDAPGPSAFAFALALLAAAAACRLAGRARRPRP